VIKIVLSLLCSSVRSLFLRSLVLDSCTRAFLLMLQIQRPLQGRGHGHGYHSLSCLINTLLPSFRFPDSIYSAIFPSVASAAQSESEPN
jgi:hypothetical protein